ncbi:MAG: hypothetical protein HYX52_05720 [Chloroflexi bacterium]|nr:hypothetical protein [Chloroflexota bacterium]
MSLEQARENERRMARWRENDPEAYETHMARIRALGEESRRVHSLLDAEAEQKRRARAVGVMGAMFALHFELDLWEAYHDGQTEELDDVTDLLLAGAGDFDADMLDFYGHHELDYYVGEEVQFPTHGGPTP